ncbi:MAG: energy transducer TonB [Terriglobales bacterium]
MNRFSRFLVPLILAAGTVAVGQDSNQADVSKPAPGAPQRIRVSSGVTTGLLIKKVTPKYPEEARRNLIQGTVVLQALIGRTGDVEDLTLISGDPSLAPAAIKAVKKWKYRPYMFRGDPVAVDTQIIVNFQLTRR